MNISVVKHAAIVLFIFTLSACGKPELDIEYQQEVAPIMAKGEVYDPDANSTEDFEITVGPRPEERVYNTFQAAVFHDLEEEQQQMRIQFFNVVPIVPGFGGNVETVAEEHPAFALYFEVAFDADNLAADFASTFYPGAVFEVGTELGQVDIAIRLPEATGNDLPPSRSSFLAAPQGTLEIISKEFYEYHLRSNFRPEIRSGSLLEARFSATVGRYDQEQDELDGVPGYTTTDEVFLQDFQVRFFITQ